MRLLLYYVAYNYELFSIWHSPILSPIFTRSPSILTSQRISPWSSRTALHSPSIKKSLPHLKKVHLDPDICCDSDGAFLFLTYIALFWFPRLRSFERPRPSRLRLFISAGHPSHCWGPVPKLWAILTIGCSHSGCSQIFTTTIYIQDLSMKYHIK